MFGRRRKDVDVPVMAQDPVLEDGFDWTEERSDDQAGWVQEPFSGDQADSAQVQADQTGGRRRGGGQPRAARALAPRVGAARAALSPYAATTRERLAPAVAGARQRVVPAVAGARERMVPAVTGARGRVAPAVAGARGTLVDSVAPALATAVSAAVAAAREGKADREEARRRGATALAALRGELPRRQRRWPVALISLLTGAVAGAAAGIVARRAAAPSEPTYIPADSPRPSSPQPEPATNATPAAVDLPAEPVGGPSDLGWPEQSQEPFAGSDRDAVLARDQVDLTDGEVDVSLVEDSSETHKPTA